MSYTAHLPATKLIRQDGVSTTFHQLLDCDVLIVAMFYAGCMARCVPAGRLLVRTCKLLKPFLGSQSINFALVTLDSDNDTLNKLREHRKTIGADDCENVGLYRGDFQEVEHLRYRLGMCDEVREVDRDKSQHKSHSVVINNRGGQVRHITPFKNPIEVARVILQISPEHLGRYNAWRKVKDLDYAALTNEELFENASSLHPRYTIPFLSEEVRKEMLLYAESQGGLVTPLKSDKKRYPLQSKSCCCGHGSGPQISKAKLIEIPCTEQTTDPPVPP